MSETNEAEVVGRALYHEKYGVACPWEADSEKSRERWRRRGALALTKARELDRARGGTLTADEVGGLSRIYATSDVLPAQDMRGMLDHAAAQGRTIAALQSELKLANESTERERSAERALRRLGWTYTEAAEEWRPPLGPSAAPLLDAIAARDERIAELVRQERAVSVALGKEVGLRKAAESALAALRQAAHDARSAWLKGESTAQAMTALQVAMDATPAEHPDTATLRAIREWLATPSGQEPGEYSQGFKDCERAVAELLGDSGPSGGGERCGMARHFYEQRIGAPCTFAANHAGPHSWWTTPTIPPDVAASEDRRPKDCNASEPCGDSDCACVSPPQDATEDDNFDPRAVDAATPQRASEATPTPAEDWRSVEEALGFVDVRMRLEADALARARAALARLKDEPRRAAEAMRERCAAQAANAVAAIVEDLSDRRGLKHEWNQIDDDVQREIRGEWARLIANAVRVAEVTP